MVISRLLLPGWRVWVSMKEGWLICLVHKKKQKTDAEVPITARLSSNVKTLFVVHCFWFTDRCFFKEGTTARLFWKIRLSVSLWEHHLSQDNCSKYMKVFQRVRNCSFLNCYKFYDVCVNEFLLASKNFASFTQNQSRLCTKTYQHLLLFRTLVALRMVSIIIFSASVRAQL